LLETAPLPFHRSSVEDIPLKAECLFRQATKIVRLPTGIGVHFQTGILFTFAPERRSASLRNQLSSSSVYPYPAAASV
jgi:hypothetical protein